MDLPVVVVMQALDGVVKVIEALPEAADQKLIEYVADDLGIAVDEIRASRLLTDEDGEALAEDVDHIATIFGATATEPAVSAVSLDKALLALTQSKRLAKVDAAFEDSPTGQVVLERAREWLQRNAQDDIADQRFAQARSFIDDGRLPGIVQGVDTFSINNVELVVSFAVVDVLTESVVAVQEALTMWSRLRTEEKLPELTLWSNRLLDILEFVDVALAAHVYDVVAATRLLDIGRDTKDSDAALPADGAAPPSVVALDEAKLVGILSTIETFAEGVDACIKPSVDALYRSMRPLMNKIEVRKLVADICVRAAEFTATPLPSGASAAVEEWKAASGKHNESFLERASELIRCHKKLSSS